MFPKPQDGPTSGPELSVDLRIAIGVSRELRSPVVRVGFRRSAVKWTPVPKAAVHEYGNPSLAEDYVGS
jgi:hypothetical protein